MRGNQHLPRGEVLALLSGLEGQHLLQTDLEAWRRRVLGSPWVEQAALRRVLPSTVEVVIRERTPLAIGRIRGDLYLVDEQGTVIDEYGPNYAQFDLPIVDGLADEPSSGGPTDRSPRASCWRPACCDALDVAAGLMKRVSQIDVASAHDAVVLLDQDPALVHLGDEQFVERLQRIPGTVRSAALARAGHRVRGPAVRRPRLRAAVEDVGRPTSGGAAMTSTTGHETRDARSFGPDAQCVLVL